jgi:hypothetical protein
MALNDANGPPEWAPWLSTLAYRCLCNWRPVCQPVSRFGPVPHRSPQTGLLLARITEALEEVAIVRWPDPVDEAEMTMRSSRCDESPRRSEGLPRGHRDRPLPSPTCSIADRNQLAAHRPGRLLYLCLDVAADAAKAARALCNVYRVRRLKRTEVQSGLEIPAR